MAQPDRGAEVVQVALDFSWQRGRTLDLDKLLAALVPGTATLVLNSPNNPTGWTIARERQSAVLKHCRRLGIRIVADDLYECVRFGAPGNHAPPAPGAMYASFRVDGLRDSVAFCTRLVREHGLGLAPGIAFGLEGEGFIRWCFPPESATLDQGIERLARALAATAA